MQTDTSQPQTAIATTFSNGTLVSYVFRGNLAWIAADVGAALGYDPGGFRACLGNWAEELIEGQDVETLRGADLKEFKKLLDVSVQITRSRAPNLTILREAGLHVICLRTEKPLGRLLRRHLATEILPKLVRREPILPAPTRAPAPVVAPAPAPVPVLAGEWSTDGIALRKALLLAQIANDMSPAVSSEARDAIRANAAAMLTGARLAPMLPRLAGDGVWLRPHEIARKIGQTLHSVGRAISALNLRGGEHSRSHMDQRAHTDGQCVVYLYNAHACSLIADFFAAKGIVNAQPRGPADVAAAIAAATKPAAVAS